MKITFITIIFALKSLVLRRIIHLSIIFMAWVANAGVIFEEQFTDAGLPGWTYHETTTYNRGTIVSGVDGGALRVFRSGSSGAYGNIGYRHSFSVPVNAETRVRFAIFPVSSSVRNYTGDGNSEYPAQVAIKCSTPNGPYTLVIAYNEDAVDLPNRSWADGYQISRTRVQGWLANEPYRIRDYVTNATEITEIDLLSSGWDFEGRWDSLTIEDSAGTNNYNAELLAHGPTFSDTSGTANSRDPGVGLGSYPAGSTIRITVEAVQYGGDPFAVDAVLNIDGPGVQDFVTPLYDSHTCNGDIRRTLTSGTPQYISWDWTIPVNATPGEYYIASTLRLASDFNVMVATIDSVDNILDASFLVSQPLAAPSGVAMDPTSDTAPAGASTSFSSDGITKDNTPTFSWGSVPGAAAYRWQVVDTVNNIVEEKTTMSTSCAPSTLSDGSYRIRVRAMESEDCLGRWSDYVGLIIDTVAPSAPILLSPLNGSMFTNTIPALSWSAANDSVGIHGYEVTFETQILFDEVTTFTQETTFSPPALTPGMMTYWRVRAVDVAGNTSDVSPDNYFSYKNLISKVLINGITTKIGSIKWGTFLLETWWAHIPQAGAGESAIASFPATVNLEWETKTPAKISLFATAYGSAGKQETVVIKDSYCVTNDGSMQISLDGTHSGVHMPGDEHTHEVVFSAYIFNEGYNWVRPADVSHSVVAIPENMSLGARPAIPNVAWAKKDILDISNNSFTTNRAELLLLYDQYRTAYDEVYNSIASDVQEGLDSQVMDAFGQLIPASAILGPMVFGSKYTEDKSLIDLAFDVMDLIDEVKDIHGWGYVGLLSYISKSVERVVNYEEKALYVQYYGYMCTYLADAIGGSIVTASDGVYSDKIDITWTPMEINGAAASSYDVLRAETNYATAATILITCSGYTYADTNIIPGVTYYYWVRGWCSEGPLLSGQPDAGYAAAPPTADLVTLSNHGTPSPSGTQTYVGGTTVSSSVNSPVSGASGIRYVCTGYTGTGDAPSGSGTSCSFTLNQNSTLTWNWKTQFWLDVGSSGSGFLSTDDSWLDAGANLTITASPSNHWHFTQWRGDTNGCAIISNEMNLTMDGPHTVSADFVLDQHQLVLTTPCGQANTTAGTNWFDYGTVSCLVITNSPVILGGTQYVCSGWTGTGSVPAYGSTTNTTTFVLTNDSSIVWQWCTNYWFQSDKIGKGTITLSSNVWLQSGAVVMQTATPAQYYIFGNWQGQTNGCSISGNRISVTMDSAKLIIGCFNTIVTSNNVPFEWLAQYGLTNFNADDVSDRDHDGMSTWQEWLAGCNPVDSNSVFRFTSGESASSGQGTVIRWPSISNRFYDLSRATNLMGTTPFTTLLDSSNMPAMPPENVYTDSVQGVGPYFYKVDVHE